MRACGLLLLIASPAAFALGEDPAEIVRQLESRLIAAQHVLIESEIRAQGAFTAQLQGHTEIAPRNHLIQLYAGQFGGQPVELKLLADTRASDIGQGASRRHEATQAETNRSMIIGLLRMGLLHNLTRLADSQGPDHASGGAERWVALDSFRPTTFAQDGELDGTYSFGFDVVVDGEAAGSARLWLDSTSGLPRRREQTTRLAQGEVTVVEDYRRFVVE